MRKSILLVIIILLVLAGIWAVFFKGGQVGPDGDILPGGSSEISYVPESSRDLIKVTSPSPGEVIKSPITVKGEARGQWFFEATFPIVLVNWDGLIIAEGYATAKDEWMTTDFVPFEGSLTFTDPTNGQDYSNWGSLILQRSNPSDLPVNNAAVEMRIRFK